MLRQIMQLDSWESDHSSTPQLLSSSKGWTEVARQTIQPKYILHNDFREERDLLPVDNVGKETEPDPVWQTQRATSHIFEEDQRPVHYLI